MDEPDRSRVSPTSGPLAPKQLPGWWALVQRIALGVALVSLLALLTGWLTDQTAMARAAGATLALAMVFGVGAFPAFRGYRFTCWIIAAFVVAMIYPDRFLSIDLPWTQASVEGTRTAVRVDLRHPWLMISVVQLVMFGMGTQMRIADLAGVVRAPHAVGVGLFCQFTIMPLLGMGLAKFSGLPREIAAGVVLIGSCSSGLASNVMVYMAHANLALSVTLTTVATLLAPLVTPTWMKLLAGEMVEVEFSKMMITIIKIVVVPIGAALVHDYLRQSHAVAQRWINAAGLLAAAWIVTLVAQQTNGRFPANASDWWVLSGFLWGAILVGCIYHAAAVAWPRIESLMPLVSMSGIVYFTLVTTAAGRDALLSVGVLLFFVAVLHNTLGYCFGYGLSRVLGLDVLAARTVALEVGLQNGGMASGLAGAMGKLGTVGLAAAIFSPWMNVSGSILANYWRKRSVMVKPHGEERELK